MKINYRIFYLFVFSILFASCYDVEQNCTQFKTGNFRFENKINGIKKNTVFKRTESLEIETYEGKTDTSTIRWINDCEYVLRKLHPKNRQEEKALDIRILSTSKDGYVFEYGLVGSEKKQKGTVTKIK